jgi:hypothetical protein
MASMLTLPAAFNPLPGECWISTAQNNSQIVFGFSCPRPHRKQAENATASMSGFEAVTQIRSVERQVCGRQTRKL